MFTFCKPISSKKRFAPFRKLDEHFSFTLFENAEAIPIADWQQVTLNRSPFFDKAYLQLIESCGNNKLAARYVIVYNRNKPCGILYFQIVDFSAGIFGDLLNGQLKTNRSHGVKLLENYIGANKGETLMRLFTCGNNLVSGDYGFLFSLETDKEKALSLALTITDIVSKEEKLNGTISAVLLKDFAHQLEPKNLLEDQKYTGFLVDPNMVVDLPANLKNLSEYILLFSKKYRNRARTILTAGNELKVRSLDLPEIEKFQKEIYALYELVFDKAKFKLLKLPENYFTRVKTIFPQSFFITGFFYNEQLIAFTSYFLLDNGCLEAHYIGFDYSYNAQFELYQNILYCNIKSAIESGKVRVNLGRTAAEIKTTVGAKARDLICYARPQNTISRFVMKPFISFLQPAEWTPRNPFKEDVKDV